MCHSHNSYEFSHSHNNNKLTGKRFVQSKRSLLRKRTSFKAFYMLFTAYDFLNNTFMLRLPICIGFIE